MGLFIVLEGFDGCGKTGQSKTLAKALNAEWMCYPDRSTFYGSIIDSWLKGEWSSRYHEPVEERVPTLHLDGALFQAAQTMNRLETVRKLKKLRGDWRHIVCDRYWPSGYAYGSADGLSGDLLVEVHESLPQPDLFILMDLPVDVAAARVIARGGDKREVYDKRGPEYARRVAAAYDGLWKQNGASLFPDVHERWVRVDATGTPEEVQMRLLRVVNERIEAM